MQIICFPKEKTTEYLDTIKKMKEIICCPFCGNDKYSKFQDKVMKECDDYNGCHTISRKRRIAEVGRKNRNSKELFYIKRTCRECGAMFRSDLIYLGDIDISIRATFEDVCIRHKMEKEDEITKTRRTYGNQGQKSD